MGIYEVRLWRKLGFQRKRCKKCGRYFWTLDPDRTTCGDSPCDEYAFLGNPPTRRKYTQAQMESEFLKFFEEKGHKVLRRYPVVARWRDDIYLTIASIANFQPWVTSGSVPPPANPLVISQPSIRLKDIDNVGRSGKHFTLFFMGGHHAFNSEEETVYWNHETVEFCHEFLTEKLGIAPEEITYVEGFWEGGGNAGEDFEVNVRGLEVATLVFMRYAIKNGSRQILPLQIVDTGYGMERLTWLSRGDPTSYDAIFGPMVEKIQKMAGVKKPAKHVLQTSSKLAGAMDVESGRGLKWLRERVAREIGLTPEETDHLLRPIENVYAVADHLRCLAFMFGDGITPSNMAEGYLARLVLRRTIRLLKELGIDANFLELMEYELELLKSQFPELWERRSYILTVSELEHKRYQETLSKGERLVERMIRDGLNISDQLFLLYDSHGIPPEIVKEICKRRGIKVEIPENFYIRLASLHSSGEKHETPSTIPSGQHFITRPLYYEDPYMQEFEATVLAVKDDWVVLDQTAFYPEGGGQPADTGELRAGEKAGQVIDVQKSGGAILHHVKPNPFKVGDRVRGKINWERRASLMRHHTATHILLEAARRVLGEHVWQHGAQKGTDRSRLDITHYKRISGDELRKIEFLANQIIIKNLPVRCRWVDRNRAEQAHGFRLYQGGVVPGRTIRVVEIENFNVQACAGTHCRTTGEVGPLCIIRSERIQDGVERLEFCAGEAAIKFLQQKIRQMEEASQILRSRPDELVQAAQKLFAQWKETTKELDRLREKVADVIAPSLLRQAKRIGKLKLIAQELDFSTKELIKIAQRMTKLEPASVVLLLTKAQEKTMAVAACGHEAIGDGMHAGNLVSQFLSWIGGKGGGKMELGQGGGGDPRLIPEALKRLETTIQQKVGKTS